MKKLLKKVRQSKSGFTLIELIVVIAILAILAVVLIPVVGGQIADAHKKAGQSDAAAVLTAAQLYATEQETSNATLSGTSMDATAITAMEKDRAFGSICKPDGTPNDSSFKINSVTLDGKGAVISVSIDDSNGTGFTAPSTK